MSERGSRFQVSVVTFGPVGRVVATALLLGIVVSIVISGNPFYYLFMAAWLVLVVPRAMKDIWRRAELPETDLTQLRDRTARELAAAADQRSHHAFATPPTRW